jgi:hypothetical protein
MLATPLRRPSSVEGASAGLASGHGSVSAGHSKQTPALGQNGGSGHRELCVVRTSRDSLFHAGNADKSTPVPVRQKESAAYEGRRCGAFKGVRLSRAPLASVMRAYQPRCRRRSRRVAKFHALQVRQGPMEN